MLNQLEAHASIHLYRRGCAVSAKPAHNWRRPFCRRAWWLVVNYDHVKPTSKLFHNWLDFRFIKTFKAWISVFLVCFFTLIYKMNWNLMAHLFYRRCGIWDTAAVHSQADGASARSAQCRLQIAHTHGCHAGEVRLRVMISYTLHVTMYKVDRILISLVTSQNVRGIEAACVWKPDENGHCQADCGVLEIQWTGTYWFYNFESLLSLTITFRCLWSQWNTRICTRLLTHRRCWAGYSPPTTPRN